jgi:hypothetical protein
MAAHNDFAKFSSNQIADLIKQADAKAVSTLYVLGISTAALLARINAVKAAGGPNPAWGMTFAIAILLILISLKAVLSVIYPRGGKPEKGDMTYFESIAAQTKDAYLKNALGMTEDNIARAIHTNAYNLACVASKKYRALRVSLITTASSIVTTILILLFS